MRTVVNFDTAKPRKSWVVGSALLWDRIGLPGYIPPLTASDDPDEDGIAFLSTLTDDQLKDLICFPLAPLTGVSRHRGDGLMTHHYEVSYSSDVEFFRCRLNPKLIPWHRAKVTKLQADASDDPIDFDSIELEPESEDWSLVRHKWACLTQIQNDMVNGRVPSLDILSQSRSSLIETATQPGDQRVIPLECFLPLMPESIGAAQLTDFRSENELRRISFQTTADDLVASFRSSSSVADLERNARLCKRAMEEQLDILRRIYRNTRIDAVKHAMGLSITPPAVVTWVCSVFHIPFFAPAAIFATIPLMCADILRTLEDGKDKVNSSPWAYLWYLDRL